MTDSTRFGYTSDKWDRMVEVGYDYLENLAARGGDTDYSTFCATVNANAGSHLEPYGAPTDYLLGDVARRSFDERGVAITGIVHYKGGGLEPGPGFYGISQELGLLRKGALTENDKLDFMAKHLPEISAAYERRP